MNTHVEQRGVSRRELLALAAAARVVHRTRHQIDAATWRLEVFGSGRSLFAQQQGTPAPGTPWKLGAVGVAEWTGVPLAEVLERAGLRRDAVDVMPQGLDAPYLTGGVDYGHIRRPLPIGKALDDVLLAYEMNGEALPPDHGFPVRLVVPGWIGVASITWVGSIAVSSTAHLSLEHEVVPDDRPVVPA